MAEYHDIKRAQSPQAIGGITVAGVFGFGFLLIEDIAFRIFGLLCLAAVISGLYAIWKREEYSIHIAASTLEWHYPRSKNPSGKIHLFDVNKVTIDEGNYLLTLHLKNSDTPKIKLACNCDELSKFMKSNYPNIAVEYIVSTPSS